MTTTILTLHTVRFDTRVALGGCLMNIDGETYECAVTKDSHYNFRSPTYTVMDKQSGRTLCTFRPHHVFGLAAQLFQIQGVSTSGGTGTLIVPLHGMLDCEEEEDVEAGCYTCPDDVLAL